MGSKRTLEDPAAQTAAAEVDCMRPADAAAAAVQQPSSSQEQFVNTGMLDDVVLLILKMQYTSKTCLNRPLIMCAGLQTWLERRRQWTQKPPDFKRTARKRAHS